MKKTRRAWIVYTVLRLLFFAVPFGIVYALGLSLGFSIRLAGVIATAFAALIGISLSIIFLSKPRAEASRSIYEARERRRAGDEPKNEDESVEDDAVDAPAAPDAPAGDPETPETPSEPGSAAGPDAAATR